jgi:hypothetical protein
MSELRIYGKWSGCPNGISEDTTRCVQKLWGSYVSYQCSRKRGFGPDGLYCKQHASKLKEPQP